MKNLKNIIASIILVVISFVSYTQNQYTLKCEFYLTDSTDIENVTVDTFNVSNTVTQLTSFSLSEDTLDLGELNSTMNFSMDSTIYKNNNVLTNSASVTKIYLVSDSIDNTTIVGYFGYINEYTSSPPSIDSIDSLIPTLIDSLENGVKYKNLIFEIEYSGDMAYTGFAIDYKLEETSSIDTEVIEVSNTRVYPNPVMNSLNIEFETINTDTEVEIYSTTGQLMYKDVEYRNFGINKVSVDMSNYQSGMYIVKLGNEVKKVIKQ